MASRQRFPQEQGFDVNVAGDSGGAAGSHWWPYDKPIPSGRYAGLEEETDEYLADRLTRIALEWLDTLPDDQPFFLYLSHYAVHTPIEPRPDYEAHFEGKEPDGGHKNPTYAGMIKSLDDSVGKVLDYLEEHGLANNTISQRINLAPAPTAQAFSPWAPRPGSIRWAARITINASRQSLPKGLKTLSLLPGRHDLLGTRRL